jgi:hypothetical protein
VLDMLAMFADALPVAAGSDDLAATGTSGDNTSGAARKKPSGWLPDPLHVILATGLVAFATAAHSWTC